jgi:Lar family restriction alleviation protein
MLMKCPFCGSRDARVEWLRNLDVPERYRVICNKCKAASGWAFDKPEAVRKWTVRYVPREQLCFEDGHYVRDGD